jgi:hypothetical protein
MEISIKSTKKKFELVTCIVKRENKTKNIFVVAKKKKKVTSFSLSFFFHCNIIQPCNIFSYKTGGLKNTLTHKHTRIQVYKRTTL